MRLVLVTVCLAFHLTVVSPAPKCPRARKCTDKFVVQANQAANDQDMYCIYVREKISCLENTQGQCTQEQWKWVQDDIMTTREADPECSSSNIARTSLVAAIGFALISYVFKH